MAEISSFLSFDNQAFKFFVFASAALVLKIFAIFPLTAFQRMKHKVLISPEDTILLPGSKIETHPDVERVRRAHQNDLENILIFFPAAFGYLMTGPTRWVAIILIALFTVSRFVHTFVYAVRPKQPARVIAFLVGYAVTGYMAVVTAVHFY